MTNATQTMRAAALDRFGGPDELALKEIPIPEVSASEVLIRVESIGVGVWDPYEMSGGFHEEGMTEEAPSFPYVPGSDCAGTVAAVGADVETIAPGDRVYAFTLVNPKGGSYAEYVALDEERVSRIPEGMGIREAGAFPVDGMTALRGLRDALELEQGESVAIFGASGGVGHLAVQLAKRMGARVFAIASGKDGVDLVRRLGADAAVDGKREDAAAVAREFAPDGVDAALLTAGGPEADRALEAVRAGGRAAYPEGVMPEPEAPAGVHIAAYNGIPDEEAIATLNRMASEGPFEVVISGIFELDEAADALSAVSGHHIGKYALAPRAQEAAA